MNQKYCVRCLCALLILLSAMLVAQDRKSSGYRQTSLRKRQAKYREGSRIVNQPGHFHKRNGAVEFRLTSNKQVFRVLENLALERILSQMANAEPPQWSVTGTMTEFQGSNYLLVQRAILKFPDE